MLIKSNTISHKKLYATLSAIAATVLEDEPLAKHTTFKIGGPADLFCIVNTADQLIETVKLCRENEIPLFILGGGSNILVADAGIRGVTVKNRSASLTVDNNYVTVESGYYMPKLARQVAKYELSGCEFMQTIPGTIGGGIHQNARFRHPTNFQQYEGLSVTQDVYVGQLVDNVLIMSENNSVTQLSNSDCHFVYEGFFHSGFQNSTEIIINVQLHLKFDNPQIIYKRLNMYASYRHERRIHTDGQEIVQPLDAFTGTRPQQPAAATAGCVFFNQPNKFDHPTGRMIDLCGLKGKRIGNAEISPQHANYIVNLGQARATDVRDLMDLCKKEVQKKFSVDLHEEIEFVGDW